MAHQFKKQYGQNFLRNDKYAQKLVAALQLTSSDTVIEIGPGEGKVTNLLLQQAGKVIGVEIDYQLIPKLIQRFGEDPKFELEHVSILDVDVPQLLAKFKANGEYKVVGSLPYNISKLIIANFLALPQPPQVMSFIVQEEVAQEYVAQAPKASFLSNWIRLYADVKKLETIPKGQFFPVPQVNGGILVITPHQKFTATKIAELQKLIRIGFQQPRKTLRNNIKSYVNDAAKIESLWTKLGLGENVRPAELEFSQWLDLQEALANLPIKR